MGIMLIFFYLIPNGRLPTKWAYIPLLSSIFLVSIYNITEIGLIVLSAEVLSVVNFTLIGLILLAGGLQIYRYLRGSNAMERQQTKLILFGLLAFVLSVIIWFSIFGRVLDIPAGTPRLLANIVGLYIIFATTTFLPVALTIAIMRYRLWDLDFAINRSLVYGALTIFLGALFGSILLIINTLFQGFSGGPLVALTLSAALFGAIFHPTRRRLQRFVDQRFYHIYIDYQKTPLPTPVSSGQTQVLRQTDFGTYKNLELIGRGGMAEVYKSTHPTLGTPVAIKVLPISLASQPDFRKRFIREAQIVTSLEHPHIVRVFDYGQQDDKHYMVMEYVSGRDLNDFLQTNGKLSLATCLPLIQQIARALDYAHAQGLVHRDIKPSNILLDANNDMRVVLTDFGIAKLLDAQTAMTGTGGVLGTFDYIAPEQIEASPTVDGRADLYAFGVMVYQMLTGELPFKHNNPGALLMAHMTQPPPDPRKITPSLSRDAADAIQRAMAKNPLERFGLAQEFAAELNG
jgi:predicted Ser/Thr protein kinase